MIRTGPLYLDSHKEPVSIIGDEGGLVHMLCRLRIFSEEPRQKAEKERQGQNPENSEERREGMESNPRPAAGTGRTPEMPDHQERKMKASPDSGAACGARGNGVPGSRGSAPACLTAARSLHPGLPCVASPRPGINGLSGLVGIMFCLVLGGCGAHRITSPPTVMNPAPPSFERIELASDVGEHVTSIPNSLYPSSLIGDFKDSKGAIHEFLGTLLVLSEGRLKTHSGATPLQLSLRSMVYEGNSFTDNSSGLEVLTLFFPFFSYISEHYERTYFVEYVVLDSGGNVLKQDVVSGKVQGSFNGYSIRRLDESIDLCKALQKNIIREVIVSILNDIYADSDVIIAKIEKAKQAELAKAAAAPPNPAPPPPVAPPPPSNETAVARADSTPPRLMPRNAYALVIGIDAYSVDDSIPPLQNAVADSKAIAEALRSHYGFQVRELYDAQATRSGIHLAIRETLKQLGEGENLLIYYAGHGWEDTMVKEGYWVPVDGRMNDPSTFVNNAELHKLIRAMEKAQHVFIVADSCFSGSFLSRAVDGRSIGVRTEGAAPDSTEVLRFFQKMDNRKSRLVLTSGGNEPVPDGGRDGHSVFGYYFLRALTHPDEPVFTAAELMQRVQKAVANNSYQTPLVGDLKGAGHEEGQMVFIRKTGNH